MHSLEEDVSSRFKLAQLYHLTYDTTKSSSNLNALKRIVNVILADDVNINYKVTIVSYKNHLKDCTALHFLYYDFLAPRDFDTFNNLLQRGADFTIKNANGQTVLHLIMSQFSDEIVKQDIPCIKSVLSAHVKFRNSVNPHDDNGLSHLHGACIANHVEALELFLENGASADEVVNLDAPQFAGYTPLHFAAEFHSFEAARMLVNRGANMNARDAKGVTPLDVLVECSLELLNYLRYYPAESDHAKTYRGDVSNNEKIMKLLLEQQCLPTIGLSSLHVACTFSDMAITEKLLPEVVDIDYAVPTNSRVRPGNTAVHFAAGNSVEAVKMLVNRGARFDVANACGLTPLDECANRYNAKAMRDILSCDESWCTTCMTDETIQLSDFVRATAESDPFKLFLHNSTKGLLAIPSDSWTFPGCTILHLAVICSTRNISEDDSWNKSYDVSLVTECLKNGLDVNVQDARGRTPIHLAFRSDKYEIARWLLARLDEADEVANLVDDDGLSYLHVACSMLSDSLVEKLLRTSSPNVAYSGESSLSTTIRQGTTPLHVAVARGSLTTAKMLLRSGADLHATDNKGFAPIHSILLSHTERKIRRLKRGQSRTTKL